MTSPPSPPTDTPTVLSLDHSDGLRQGLLHHVQALTASLGELTRQPMLSLACVLVVALALFVTSVSYFLYQESKAHGVGSFSNRQISLYLEPLVSDPEAQRLADKVRELEGVESVELVTPRQALVDYQQLVGLSNLEDLFGSENPLPYLLLVTIHSDLPSGQWVQALSGFPRVEIVQNDDVWIARLNAITTAALRGLSVAVVLSLGGALIFLSHSLRLNITRKTDAIVIARLSGASQAFVRRPFLYSGFWYGVVGGLIAIALWLVLQQWVAEPINGWISTYENDFRLRLPRFEWLMGIPLLGIGIGWLAAWIALLSSCTYRDQDL